MPVSKFLFGNGLENEIRVGFPLMDLITDREDGEGSEYIDAPDGSVDTWRQNKMFTMQAEARWIPDGPGTNPVQTQLSGPVSWEEFIDWARDGRALRFVPDENVPDFYVDNTYLVEPRKGFGSLSPDIKRNVPLKLRNPAKSFHEAMRGIMFEYAPQMSLTDPVAASFSRASTATRHGLAGVATEGVNVLRDRHYDGAQKTTLLEDASTIKSRHSEDFTNWTAIGTPVLVAGAVTLGELSLSKVTDDSAVGQEYYIRSYGANALFASGGIRGVSIYVYPPVSPSPSGARIQITDSTAAADRLFGLLTWSGTNPALQMSTGTYLGAQLVGSVLGKPIWRLHFQTTSVTAANSHDTYLLPASTGTDTGDITWGGFQVESALAFPSSYIKTTTADVSRSSDFLSWPFAYKPQAMFTLIEFIERGSVLLNPVGVVGIHDSLENVPAFRLLSVGGYNFGHFNGVASVNINAPVTPAFGDSTKLLGILFPNGSLRSRGNLNGGAEQVSTDSAALSFAAAWKTPTSLWVNSRGTFQPGFNAFARVKIGPLTYGGVTRDTIAKALAA